MTRLAIIHNQVSASQTRRIRTVKTRLSGRVRVPMDTTHVLYVRAHSKYRFH
jgi:hypothetical protein